eukprot:628077-Rhodomonas_salina.3
MLSSHASLSSSPLLAETRQDAEQAGEAKRGMLRLVVEAVGVEERSVLNPSTTCVSTAALNASIAAINTSIAARNASIAAKNAGLAAINCSTASKDRGGPAARDAAASSGIRARNSRPSHRCLPAQLSTTAAGLLCSSSIARRGQCLMSGHRVRSFKERRKGGLRES